MIAKLLATIGVLSIAGAIYIGVKHGDPMIAPAIDAGIAGLLILGVAKVIELLTEIRDSLRRPEDF